MSVPSCCSVMHTCINGLLKNYMDRVGEGHRSQLCEMNIIVFVCMYVCLYMSVCSIYIVCVLPVCLPNACHVVEINQQIKTL
jgi:hypothetical protein